MRPIVESMRTRWALFVLVGLVAGLHGRIADAAIGDLVFSIESPGVQTAQVACDAGLVVEDFESVPGAPGYLSSYNATIGTYTKGTSDFVIEPASGLGGAGGSGFYIRTEIGDSYTLTLAQPAGYFGFWWSAGNGNNEITVNMADGSSQTFSTQSILDAPGLMGTPGMAGGHFGNPNAAYLGEDPDEVFAFVNVFTTDSAAKITSMVFNEKPGGVGAFESDNHSSCTDLLDPNTGSPIPQTGTIVVNKVVVPAGPVDLFTFTHDIPAAMSPFQVAGGGTQTFDDVPIGVYTITESDPGGVGANGYTLSNLSCQDSIATGQASSTDLASRAATVRLETGETVTCEFVNAPIPTATATVTSTPTNTPSATPTTTPSPQPNGAACSDPAQCVSMNCVDGACCNLPCDGPSESCFSGICRETAAPAPAASPWGLLAGLLTLTGIAAIALRRSRQVCRE